MSSDKVECPLCGKSIHNVWKYFDNFTTGEESVECPHCGGEITITRDVSVDYEARKAE